MLLLNSAVFVLILRFSQVLGQQCSNPGDCRHYGCCREENQGNLPDWHDGVNCTQQIPKTVCDVRK